MNQMAVDYALVDYISKGLRDGHSIDSLRKACIENGWNPQDVEDSIRNARISTQSTVPGTKVPQLPQQTAVQGQKMGFVRKVKMIISSPSGFFEAVKSEEGIGSAYKYYLITLLFTNILVLPMLIMGSGSGFSLESLTMPSLNSLSTLLDLIQIMMFAVVYVLLVLAILLVAGIYHVFARLLGGSGGYSQSFKALAYGGTTPSLIGAPITIAISAVIMSNAIPEELVTLLYWVSSGVSLVIGIWAIVIVSFGFSRLHDVSFLRGLVIALTVPLIMIAIMLLLTVYAYSLLVFNPSTWTGSRATGFVNLGAPATGGWKFSQDVKDDQFQLALRNYMPSRIRVTDISVTINNEECTTTGGTGTYDIGSSFTVTARCDPQSEGSSYNAHVELTYDNLDTDISGLVDSGDLTGTVS
jgi:hypothetical protein